jgi:zinc transporter
LGEGPAVSLRAGDLDAAMARADGLVWIHLSALVPRAKQWLAGCQHLPEPVREDLVESDERTRLDPLRDSVLAVIGDAAAGADPGPWEFGTLRLHFGRRCLVSTRRHPVQCASKLARAIQGGLEVRSTAELVVWLLNYAADALAARTRELVRETDRTEDEVLNGHVTLAREHLAGTRRRAALLRRHVAFRPRAIDRLRARLPAWVGEDDRYELLDVLDRMEALVEELAAIERREGALDAEVAARLAEDTNRNLYLLAIITALFAPMTLITSVFGMNLAGMPGLQDPAAFWWVMLSMVVTAALFVLILYRRRLF